MRIVRLLFLCFLQFSCTSQAPEKINGVSFVASRSEALQTHLEEVKQVYANHAAVMPFGFIRDVNSPEIIFNTDRQWFGETKKGAMQYIGLLHKNGIKTMVKPQIWIWRGEFTGTLHMNSEAHWQELEASYEKFIMTYAEMAQETGTEIFCIGTELEKFVTNRPEYWHKLISKIRTVYKGKLTYAANWDEYPRVPFWKDLDYIGIDAYFPLSDEKTPSVKQLREGWQRWKPDMEALAEKTGRPVLFTEFGYRSMDYTAKKPWLVDRNQENVNLKAQVNAKRALFDEFWGEDWFAGGYVWKWFIDHDKAGGENDNRFTPQNKPAQEVIKEVYKKY
ncbi:glycoside hydrolase TIM-barrel-like domain-containing protein [Zobellia galactanivorans]|uniref:glycoside hydrolase family 113 n=1 Tax=Zobellia galactanivorans (strain DSM 12802 / CCUG 47099 / CIP 106680 / NCIMB 13871 / Dsij) TaxID=63186 RepID=UPI0026E3792F|nr:glycoside hydrolase TIM-barrel-like domain-containing protein [Zobellia galactanivorans]MDO6808529.1 glycoside hydrolase TIM-barrel-like domain-containing protein [Zobellia galactanivorans]